MQRQLSRFRCGLVVLMLLLGTNGATALVLDWDTATYTPGSLNQGFDFDSSLAGDEVTISVSGNTNKLRPDPATGIETPAVTSTLQGGMGQNSLNFTANVGTHTEITVTVSFSTLYTQGVESVSFILFDIDKTTDSEFIKNIRATAVDGTLIAPTISNLGSAVQHTGTGLAQLLTGTAAAANNGGTGNATISFGTTAIRNFTFTFDNSSGPPRIQEFGLGDINFTPVPEVNPAFVAAAICSAALWAVSRQRRKRRPRCS